MAKLRTESLFRAACALVLLGAVAAYSGVSSADENQSSPSAKKSRFPNRYDFMWRAPPLPHYIVAMSQDDPLCDSIAKAFNKASTPKGAAPGSLYKNPMFLKWRHNPRSLPGEGRYTDLDIAMADPFNDGRPHPIIRSRLPGARSFIAYFDFAVCELPEQSDLSSAKWRTIKDLVEDPECKSLSMKYLYNEKFGDSGANSKQLLPAFSPEDLTELYPESRTRPDFRWPSSPAASPEINFILEDGRELIVLRNAVTEVTLVTEFKGRADLPKNICLIGPEVRVEIPVSHSHRPRKKPVE